MPWEDNCFLGILKTKLSHTGNGKIKPERQMTVIKVGEYTASPWLISPMFPAARSFRWGSVVWTLITDEGYFLWHESRNPRKWSWTVWSLWFMGHWREGGRGTHFLRDHTLYTVPSICLWSRQGHKLLFILVHSQLISLFQEGRGKLHHLPSFPALESWMLPTNTTFRVSHVQKAENSSEREMEIPIS